MAHVEAGSPERFGYSWERFSTLTTAQERQFMAWTSPIDRSTGWRGASFLDAGCGAGRNSYWPMTYGASQGVAFDLDERSLAAARANLMRFPQVQVETGSIYDIPYENRFDIVFSIGVVHHLSDPEKAVRELVKGAKPGGRVLVWLYGRENLGFYITILDPARKALFSWAPLSFVRLAALFPAAVLKVMLELGFTPLAYLKMLKSFPFEHLHHIVFDQMLPRTARYYRREEAVQLLAQAGLTNIEAFHVNKISWTVVGTKL
jgi:SAM-dependent methyltransferase